MSNQPSTDRGFSLIEVCIATSVLAVGLLATAGVLATGMQKLSSSPTDVIATQKAAEAIESVFSARDSHKLTWAQLQNVKGATGNDGGVFLDGPQSLKLEGADGILNTADDTTVETMTLPGPDQKIGTVDDVIVTLSGYTREIMIRNVPNENGMLRSVTVTITYQSGPTTKTYALMTYISNYS